MSSFTGVDEGDLVGGIAKELDVSGPTLSKGKTIRFPNDIGSESHYIRITIWDKVIVNSAEKKINVGKFNEQITEVTKNSNEFIQKVATTAVDTIAESASTIEDNINSYSNPVKTIILPIPLEIQTTYEANWSGTTLSPLEYVIKELLEGNTIKDDLSGLSIQGLRQMTSSASNYVARNFGVDLNKTLGVSAGIGINPYKELMYQSPDFRTFNFDWVLSPRNEDESKVLNEIINTIKKYMHPGVSGKSFDESLLYTYPSYCTIEFSSNKEENPWLFKIHDCVINSFSARYSSKFHRDDNSPTAISLNLSVTEMTILSRNNFDKESGLNY